MGFKGLIFNVSSMYPMLLTYPVGYLVLQVVGSTFGSPYCDTCRSSSKGYIASYHGSWLMNGIQEQVLLLLWNHYMERAPNAANLSCWPLLGEDLANTPGNRTFYLNFMLIYSKGCCYRYLLACLHLDYAH